MRRALLTGVAAAALTLGGLAAAQAETVYVTDPAYAGGYVAAPGYVTTSPGYVATAPGYVTTVPGYAPRRYILTEPEAPLVADAPTAYVVTPPAVVGPPMPIAPRAYSRTVVPQGGIVTTGYSTRSCFIDLAGIERCN